MNGWLVLEVHSKQTKTSQTNQKKNYFAATPGKICYQDGCIFSPNNGKELRWAQSPQNGPRVPKGPKHQKT
jgi:hypothetical protein